VQCGPLIYDRFKFLIFSSILNFFAQIFPANALPIRIICRKFSDFIFDYFLLYNCFIMAYAIGERAKIAATSGRKAPFWFNENLEAK
jgi:hypothetical protein